MGLRGRIKILRALTKADGLYISQICRRVGMNYQGVNDHLERLKDFGVVEEKRYGNIRMFEIAFDEVIIRLKRH